jgi:asparagine synthase (glutamine-hydrolysing)
MAHVQWRHVFTFGELQSLLRPDYRIESARSLYANQTSHFDEGASRGFQGSSLDAWVDLRTWMVDSGLMMWDKAGMAGSTEIRVPLLDLEFVDHVLALPEKVRSGGKVGAKGLLKEVVADEVPADILALPKHGFQLPINHWLRGELRDMFRDQTESLPEEVFAKSEIRRLWREFEQNRGDHGLKLWTLGALAGWSKAHHVTW